MQSPWYLHPNWHMWLWCGMVRCGLWYRLEIQWNFNEFLADCPGTPDCSNKGQCVTTGSSPYCQCQVGWRGSDCSIRKSLFIHFRWNFELIVLELQTVEITAFVPQILQLQLACAFQVGQVPLALSVCEFEYFILNSKLFSKLQSKRKLLFAIWNTKYVCYDCGFLISSSLYMRPWVEWCYL